MIHARFFLLAFCLLSLIGTAIAGDDLSSAIHGTVLGPGGKPVAGARVYIADGLNYQALPILAYTDATGSFSTPPPKLYPTESDRETFPPSWRILIAVPGYSLYSVGILASKASGQTFTLEPGTKVSGQVVDERGNAVAGVKVLLVSVDSRTHDRGVGMPGWVRSGTAEPPKEMLDPFVQITDAKGMWTFDGVPEGGSAAATIADPRYVCQAQQIVGKPLVARPGATIIGHALFAKDGKPAGNVRVFAQAQGSGIGWAETTTDAKGSYMLTGLSHGAYNVMADAPNADVVAAAIAGVVAQEGKTVAAPTDLIFDTGGVITGTVRDAVTGKPISDASVGCYGPHRPSSSAAITFNVTDEKGVYHLRVPVGESRVYFSSIPEGYLRGGNDVTVHVTSKGQTVSQDFTLNPGATLSGTVVDTSGKPVAGVRVLANAEWEMLSQALSDAEGKWTLRGLPNSNITLSTAAEGWENASDGKPVSVSIPIEAAVELHVQPITLGTLEGRVVTPSGVPVANLPVTARIQVPMGIGSWQEEKQTLTTDAEGRYRLERARIRNRTTFTVDAAEYQTISGGTVNVAAEATPSVSDIVLLPLTRHVTGTVRDAGNKPVVGARVAASVGGKGATSVTDAQGGFTLTTLPESGSSGAVHIYAWHSDSFAEAPLGNSASHVVLSLDSVKPAASPHSEEGEQDIAVLAQVWKESAGTKYYARNTIPADAAAFHLDRAASLLGGGKESDTFADWQLLGIINTAADMLPQRPDRRKEILDWVIPHIARMNEAGARRYAQILMAKACLKAGDATDCKRLYDQARASMPQNGVAAVSNGPGDVFAYMMMASLATLLRTGEAEHFADLAVAAARKQDNTPSFLTSVAEGLAEGGDAKLAERALPPDLPTKDRQEALSRIIVKIAPYSPTSARTLLEQLAKMPRAEGGDLSYWQALRAVVEALAAQDPAEALQLARQSGPGEGQAGALAVAAAQQKTPEVRAAAFREAFSAARSNSPGNSTWSMARIAALAYDSDPKVGAPLLDAVRDRITASEPQEVDDYQNARDRVEYAFYAARRNPAESRFLLEAEFARQKQSSDGNNPAWRSMSIALAMAAVNPDRALEMARTLPGDPKEEQTINARFDAQRKIAQYLIASLSVRRSLPFDRWTASDSWRPGTPTGW